MVDKTVSMLEKISEFSRVRSSAPALTGVRRNCEISYRALYETVIRYGALLSAEAGITPGSRVIVACDADPVDMLIAILAVRTCGGTAVPLKSGISEEDILRIQRIAAESSAKLILADQSAESYKKHITDIKIWPAETYRTRKLPEITETAEERKADEYPFIILYTSGSTDKAKAVAVQEPALLKLFAEYNEADRRTENSVLLCSMPLYHVIGLMEVALSGLYIGAQVVCMSVSDFIADTDSWFRTVSRYRVSHTGTSNFMVSMLTASLTEGKDSADSFSLASMKSMVLAGERTNPRTIDAFTEGAKRYGFKPEALNVSYGLTESGSTFTLTDAEKPLKRVKTADGTEVISVGNVLPGYELVLVDDEGKIIRDEISPGELCVSGPSVMEGYWNAGNDSEGENGALFLTFEGKNYLRTGDIGFVFGNSSDGRSELFISGRKKDILIVRGENYSPVVLEELAERASPFAVKAAAISVQGEHSEEVLLLLEEQVALTAEERAKAAQVIADAVVVRMGILPQALVFSAPGSFLYSGTGKLKRLPMRKTYLAGEWKGEILKPFSGNSVTDAPGEKRRLLSEAEIQEHILGFVKCYLYTEGDLLNDKLIQLGMNSLTLQMLLSAIKRDMGVKLPLSVLCQCPNVRSLAKRVSAEKAEEQKEHRAELAGINLPAEKALSTLQKAYIAGRNEEIEWGGTACKLYIERDIEGLEPDRFIKATATLMKKQDALRMTVAENGVPVLLDYAEPPVLVKRPEAGERERVLAETRAEMEDAVLPLSSPLFRIALTELDPALKKWRIHLHLDMISFDATSVFLFWSQLKRLYEGETTADYSGKAVRPVAPDRESYEADKAYWLAKKLPAAPQLPWDGKAVKIARRSFVRRTLFLHEEEWQRAESLCRKLGISPTVMFLTLFSHLLAGFGAGRDFTLSLTAAGREAAEGEVSGVIGDFTDIVLLVMSLKEESMAEAAKRVQETLLTDLSHRAFSSFDLMRERVAKGEAAALFPVVFTSMLGLDEQAEGESPFSAASYSRSSTPQVLLDHQLMPTKDGVMLGWDSVDEAFEKGCLDAMFASYTELVHRALAEEFWAEELREIRTKKDIEVQAAANDTAADIPACFLTEKYREIRKKYPENTAVIHQNRYYSYAALAERAGQFKALLRAKEVVEGDRVMIQMEKSFDLIASIVAAADMGAIYIPMPRDQPESRQESICAIAGARLMLTDGDCIVSPKIPTINAKEADAFEADFSEPAVKPESLAYIIYTSGSTGLPKGVAIKHASAMNTILAVNEYIGLGAEDRLMGVSSVSFDLSVYDIFGTFSVGAALVVPTEEERIDPECWLRLCREHRVTFWNSVPALMYIFLDYCAAVGKGGEELRIRDIILSGDWIPMDLYDRLQKVMPQARLTSMGGATEASIWSNYYTVEEIKPEWLSVPYGYPLPNQFFHVLDDLGRFCPCGVTGRLHIGGRGLAQEYYNEPVLTDKAFFIHPDSGERLYDTGDYGRYDKDGMLVFLGRRDTQIKINGYRIEIGEIQSAFDRAGYPETAVVVSDEGERGKKLVAFVRNNTDVSEAELKKAVGELLPGYFVPDRILCLQEFPYTANAKLDRKALLAAYCTAGTRTHDADGKGQELGETDRKLLAIIQTETKVSNLKPEDSLLSLGLSSLEIIRLANKLETEMGYRAGINEMICYRRVDDILEYYRSTDIRKEKEALAKAAAEEQCYAEKLGEEDPLYRHPVMEVIREELETVDVTSSMELSALGLSSLMVIRLANKLESMFDVRPSVHDMLRYQTLRELIGFYESNSADMQIRDEIAEKLKDKHPILRAVGEALNIAKVEEKDSFATLGASSIEIIRIGNMLEAMYGFRPKMQEFATVEDFGKLILYYEGAEVRKAEDREESAGRTRAIDLYNRCRDLDIIIWPEGEKLKFKAPHGAITPELKAELKQEKAALLDFLSDQSTITAQELTPLQMAYVLGRQGDHVLGDISAHYYVEYLAENLDIPKLQDAVNELIVRNEILRTIISPEGRVHVLRANPGYTVEVVDEEREGRDLRSEMKNHQFPLGEFPMFDVKVSKQKGETVVHIGLDCLILDGWSINMFLHQLVSAYNGEPYSVTDYTFRSYLSEERRWLREKKYYRDAQKYWEENIERLPPAPRLPLKTKLTEIHIPEFGRKRFTFSREDTFALFQRMKAYEMTPSLALCTAYMMSLSKWSEVPDVTLNLTMFNRQPIHPDVQKILGDFTNIALLGYRAEEGRNFMKAVESMREQLWNAIEYRSFNVINLLGRMAERYGDAVAAPYVFTSLIDSEAEGTEDTMAKIGFREIFAQTQTPQVVLDHQLYVRNGKLLLVLDYVKQAFEEDMLDEMFADYAARVKRLADTEDWRTVL